MKNAVTGLATAMALTLAGTAQAVPLYFDFTGTVAGGTVDTPSGAAISGSFQFESDRLLSAGPPVSGIQYTFVDWDPQGLSRPLATVAYADRQIDLPAYGLGYAYISFVDGCQPECNTGWGENFSVNVISEDPWTAGFTGQRRTQYLSVMSMSRLTLPDFPYFEQFDYFDGAAMTPFDAVTLPLYQLVGLYSETAWECVAGECTQVRDSQFNFSVDTFTRGVGERSVPEPGTLGLLGLGLLGGVLLRRRPQRP